MIVAEDLRLARGALAVQTVSSISFWDCRLTKKEFILLVTATLVAAALHLAPVLHSGLGTILTYLLPAVSYFSPLTSFFFFGLQPVSSFPGRFAPQPRTSGRPGMVACCPALLPHRVNLRNLWFLWPVLPFLIWFALLTGQVG